MKHDLLPPQLLHSQLLGRPVAVDGSAHITVRGTVYGEAPAGLKVRQVVIGEWADGSEHRLGVFHWPDQFSLALPVPAPAFVWCRVSANHSVIFGQQIELS